MRKHEGPSDPNQEASVDQIVKMATGMQLNLNSACATADKREF